MGTMDGTKGFKHTNMRSKVCEELVEVDLRIIIRYLENAHGIVVSWFAIRIFRYFRDLIQCL